MHAIDETEVHLALEHHLLPRMVVLCMKILHVAAICRVLQRIQEAQLVHLTVVELAQLRDILEDARSYSFMTRMKHAIMLASCLAHSR